jgi:hypothetical protein
MVDAPGPINPRSRNGLVQAGIDKPGFRCGSFFISIALLCAIPLVIAAEVYKLAQMPEGLPVKLFFYAFVFSAMNHFTRLAKPVKPPAANPNGPTDSD